MTAYRQAKRMQRGALTAQGGFSTTDPALRQVPCTIQCVFVPTIVSSGLQVVFNTKGFSQTPRIDVTSSGLVQAYGGGDIMYSKAVAINSVYDIVYVLTDSNTTLYVNGEKVKESPACDPMTLYNVGYYLDSNKLYFQGDYLLHRHFNYTMSADEVKALDNNGDPMGYVVPKSKRDGLLAEYLSQNLMESRKGPEVEPMAETYEFNIGSPYSQTVVSGRQYPFDCIYRVDYVVEEWDFQPSVYRLIGFYGESGASVVAGVSSWIRKSDAKIGEVQSCFIKMPNEGNPSIILYGDQDRDITTARHLKVKIKGITPVAVSISWLDSAKQMPLSDEYMEPLFQSIGGYDMAANGAPEILYNE